MMSRNSVQRNHTSALDSLTT